MRGTTNIPAVAILLRRDNKILFVLRQNTGWQDGNYTLPAGHVENLESFSQAAIRELKEEVALEIDKSNLRHLITMHETNALNEVRIAVIFEANNWQGEPYNAEPDIHAEIAWFDQDNLPSNLVPFTKLGLKAIAEGESYCEFGWDKVLL